MITYNSRSLYSSLPERPTPFSSKIRRGTLVSYTQPFPLHRACLAKWQGGVNPIEVQTVGVGSSSSCLDDVISHVHDFTFTASGSTQQCGSDFALSWVDMLGIGPYNYTVLPLDTSTSPFDVVLKGGPTTTGETGWAVNMTAGTRFTIMMK